MSEVVNAYTAYIKARKEARENARKRVQRDIRPELVEIGRVVHEAQSDGMSIADIARLMGIKNRNFIYEAKRAYAEETGEEITVREYVRKPKAEAKVQDTTVEDTQEERDFEIEDLGGGNYKVTVFGEDNYLVTDDDSGRIVFPDEWAEASAAERAVYKEIIRHIEKGGAA